MKIIRPILIFAIVFIIIIALLSLQLPSNRRANMISTKTYLICGNSEEPTESYRCNYGEWLFNGNKEVSASNKVGYALLALQVFLSLIAAFALEMGLRFKELMPKE